MVQIYYSGVTITDVVTGDCSYWHHRPQCGIGDTVIKFVFQPLKAKIIKQRKVMNQHEVEAAALNRIISMLSKDSSGQSWERRAQWRHRTTSVNISVGFILVFTCSFGPLEAFHIMRAVGWDAIPIRKFSHFIPVSVCHDFGSLDLKIKKVIIFVKNSRQFHRFCHGSVQVKQFTPSFWPSLIPDVFYFSFESIDLFIFWSKLSPSSNQHPSTNCLWRIGFSRHSICSVKVYSYFDFLIRFLNFS